MFYSENLIAAVCVEYHAADENNGHRGRILYFYEKEIRSK